MIRLSIALLLAGFMATSITADAQVIEKEKKAVLSNPGKPVSFDKTTHKFGDIEKNVPATATFTITNNDTKPLVITSVKASCGCTAPAYPKQPVQPGKTGEIKLTYNAKISGYFKKSAQVKTQDGKIYPLIIEGEVKAAPVQAEK